MDVEVSHEAGDNFSHITHTEHHTQTITEIDKTHDIDETSIYMDAHIADNKISGSQDVADRQLVEVIQTSGDIKNVK